MLTPVSLSDTLSNFHFRCYISIATGNSPRSCTLTSHTLPQTLRTESNRDGNRSTAGFDRSLFIRLYPFPKRSLADTGLAVPTDLLSLSQGRTADIEEKTTREGRGQHAPSLRLVTSNAPDCKIKKLTLVTKCADNISYCKQ